MTLASSGLLLYLSFSSTWLWLSFAWVKLALYVCCVVCITMTAITQFSHAWYAFTIVLTLQGSGPWSIGMLAFNNWDTQGADSAFEAEG